MNREPTVSRRSWLATSLGAVLVGLAGCTGDDDNGNGNGNGNGDGTTVMAGTEDDAFAFDPDSVEIAAGETVTWEWGTDTHNIVVDSQPDDADWSGHETIENTGFEYSYTFDVAGTYEYHCEPHINLDMVGEVVVTE